MIDGQRLSIATGSLNRLEHLKQSLSTWLIAPEPDEIVVVDWGNEIPLQESLREFNDSRIVIARAEGQRHWQMPKVNNLELLLASGERLLRTDNDCLLGTSFFEKHALDDGCFFAGNWKTVQNKEADKSNLAGTIYIHTADALSVNGYNERLIHYGHDDDDLYERLVRKGLKRLDIDLSTLEHLPHSDQQRYERLKIASRVPHPHEKSPKAIHDKIAGQVKHNLIQMNKSIAKSQPWTSRDSMTKWKIERISPNYIVCHEIPGNETNESLAYVDCIHHH